VICWIHTVKRNKQWGVQLPTILMRTSEHFLCCRLQDISESALLIINKVYFSRGCSGDVLPAWIMAAAHSPTPLTFLCMNWNSLAALRRKRHKSRRRTQRYNNGSLYDLVLSRKLFLIWTHTKKVPHCPTEMYAGRRKGRFCPLVKTTLHSSLNNPFLASRKIWRKMDKQTAHHKQTWPLHGPITYQSTSSDSLGPSPLLYLNVRTSALKMKTTCSAETRYPQGVTARKCII
jgi:hypothetical protein